MLISIDFSKPRQLFKCWSAILYVGIPTGLSRMITPISASVITALLATYGEFAVSAYGVGTRIEFLTASLLIALSSSISPFTGQNWGAKKYLRIKQALQISGVFSIIWGLIASAFLYFFAPELAGIFSDDVKVVETTVLFLRIVPLSFGFQGIAMIVNANLNTMNRPFSASVLIIIQMIVIYLPLAYLGSELDGIRGIFLALFVSYIFGGGFSFATSYVSLIRIQAKALRYQNQQ